MQFPVLKLQNNLLHTIINFLILPAAIAFCWGVAWFMAIYPLHNDPKTTVMNSLLAALVFATLFYYSTLIISLLWMVYMYFSLPQFKESKLYLAINKFILILCTCGVIAFAINGFVK